MVAFGVSARAISGGKARAESAFSQERMRERRSDRDKLATPPARLTGQAKGKALAKQKSAVKAISDKRAQRRTFMGSVEAVNKQFPTAIQALPGVGMAQAFATVMDFAGFRPASPARKKQLAADRERRSQGDDGGAPALPTQRASAPAAAVAGTSASPGEAAMLATVRTDARQTGRRLRGLGSTIRTGAGGLTAKANVRQKTLLGA